MTTDAPIFAAIEAGDAGAVRELVADDPSAASARDGNGVSALLQARYRNRLDLVELLLAAGPELDVFEAAALGDEERVRELVDADPSLANLFAPDGFHPLALAAFFDHPGTVGLLLERGADVHTVARHAQLQVTALHAAAAGSSNESARLLLDAGADADAVQSGGFTPLHSAAQNGDRELVELLLERGADPARATDEGKTPRDLAADGGHEEIAALL